MKLLAFLLSLLILATPGVAVARHRRGPPPTPTPIPTPPLPISNKIYGVNYGHNFAGHPYDATLANNDLNELKAAGVKSVRLYMGTSGQSDVDVTKTLAILAKTKGLITIWGVCTGGSVSTVTQWNAYLASLNGYAQWANDNGVDYFSLGNEEEFQITPSTVQSGIRTKAAQLKALYPSLKLTYATAAEPAWISAWSNTGSLDSVGFNLYVAFQDLTNQIKQNPKGYISEWNTDDGLNAVGGSQSKWATTLVKDRDIINTSGVKAYLFVLRGNGGGIDDRFSFWTGSTRRAAWTALLQ